MTMEAIVRPFQTLTDDTKASTVTAFNQVGVPIVLLTIGRSGSGKMFDGSFDMTITAYMDKLLVEQQAKPTSSALQTWSQDAIGKNQ